MASFEKIIPIMPTSTADPQMEPSQNSGETQDESKTVGMTTESAC
jgi:hypothetical protein